MDPATLAASVTALLGPYLAKAGTTLAAEAVKKLPDALGGLWKAVAQRFQGKPAAEAAANDLTAKPDDEDNQAAFALQLKKMLKEDPSFLEEIADLHDKAQASISNTGSGAVATSGGVAAGAGGIAIGGSVSGNIVMGNQNRVSNSSAGNSNSNDPREPSP